MCRPLGLGSVISLSGDLRHRQRYVALWACWSPLDLAGILRASEYTPVQQTTVGKLRLLAKKQLMLKVFREPRVLNVLAGEISITT